MERMHDGMHCVPHSNVVWRLTEDEGEEVRYSEVGMRRWGKSRRIIGSIGSGGFKRGFAPGHRSATTQRLGREGSKSHSRKPSARGDLGSLRSIGVAIWLWSVRYPRAREICGVCDGHDPGKISSANAEREAKLSDCQL